MPIINRRRGRRRGIASRDGDLYGDGDDNGDKGAPDRDRGPTSLVEGAQQHCSPQVIHDERGCESKGEGGGGGKCRGRPRRLPGTCLYDADVREVARAYSRGFLTEEPIRFTPSAPSSTLLRELHRRLGTVKGEEYTWLAMPFLRDIDTDLLLRLSDRFRPPMPVSWLKNNREWLSNLDIEQVMQQYERTIPGFRFVGVFPIDFDHTLPGEGRCVGEEMCAFDARAEWNRGVCHVGIIFNTDRHDQSGSHWVALYIGLDPALQNYGVFYYDSVAVPVGREVSAFAERVRKQLRELHGDDESFGGFSTLARTSPAYLQNEVRRQFKGTECGVFSMFFVICCTHGGIKFEDICRSMGNDDDIHAFRSVFFRPPASQRSIEGGPSEIRKRPGRNGDLGGSGPVHKNISASNNTQEKRPRKLVSSERYPTAKQKKSAKKVSR